jgi:hypothetical protein
MARTTGVRPTIVALVMNTDTKNGGRIVIYTAIFGKKDNLIEPDVTPANCDFICFTDQPLQSMTWKIQRIAPAFPDDLTRSNRRLKILTHELFSKYEFSVYVDGNVQIHGDMNVLVRNTMKNADIAAFDHAKSSRFPLKSVAEHRELLRSLGERGRPRDDQKIVDEQYAKYQKEGFPDDKGLSWNCVLVRRHNAPEVVQAMQMWWGEVERWSKRDQMSLSYVLWKTGARFSYITGDPESNEYFRRIPHRKSWPQKLNSIRISLFRHLKSITKVN